MHPRRLTFALAISAVAALGACHPANQPPPPVPSEAASDTASPPPASASDAASAGSAASIPAPNASSANP